MSIRIWRELALVAITRYNQQLENNVSPVRCVTVCMRAH